MLRVVKITPVSSSVSADNGLLGIDTLPCLSENVDADLVTQEGVLSIFLFSLLEIGVTAVVGVDFTGVVAPK